MCYQTVPDCTQELGKSVGHYEFISACTESYKPSDLPPAAILVFVHGFSDHINAYYTLFPALASRGIQTFGFDQRGWGRSVTSPATRGLSGPTSTVLADITSVIQAQLDQNMDKTPLFLMGHSMGGAQVLQYAARGPVEVRRKLRGYLAESPFIAFHKDAQPAWLTVVAARLAARILPKRQMVQKLDATAMSRDPKVCEEYTQDELCHDTGTLEGLAGLLERAEELEKGKVTIDDGEGVSIWAGHGTGDKVCSFEATQSLMKRLPVKDKQLRTYDGWFHKRK